MKNKLLAIMLAAVLGCASCKKDDEAASPVDIESHVLVDQLQLPWEILWGPDDHIWMTERNGRISRVSPADGTVIPLLTIAEVVAQGEGGLLGMALHPDFNTTPHVFVVYNYIDGGTYREKVVRFTYNGTTLTDPFPVIDDIAAAPNHNGSRLLITPDNKLLITTGDAQNQSLPQNASSLNGKILRVNLDGSIPADNPDPSSAVWSLGHRNPQGLVYVNNMLFSSEHGPSTDDEINIIEKGRNYGWPDVHGFCNTTGEQSFCTANNVKEPLQAWTPTVAVCGLDYYNHDLIPQWKNSLLLATLKNSRLMQLKLNNAHNAVDSVNDYFVNDYGRLRDICISPDGKVYFCTSNGSDDKIVEVGKEN